MLRRGVSMLRGGATLSATTKPFATSSHVRTRINGDASYSTQSSVATPASCAPSMAQQRHPSNSPLRRSRGEGVRALAGTAGARPGFGVVEEEDLVFFKSVLGEKGVVTDADALEVAVFFCKVDGFVPIT